MPITRSRIPVLAVLSLAAMVAVSPTTRGALIYGNGVELSEIDTGTRADVDDITGDDFTLGAAALLSEVRWTGVYYPGGTPPAVDDFTIRLFDYSGSLPSTTALFTFAIGNQVNRADTGVDRILAGRPYDFYSYSAVIPPTLLAAGRYVLSIQNNTASDSDDSWWWSLDVQGGDGYFINNGANRSDGALDFTLLGPTPAVPEPASVVLLGVGALGVLGYGWRRRAARA
jgi:hypothetical protein